MVKTEPSEGRAVRARADDAMPTIWRWNDYTLLPAQRRLLRCGEPVELEDRAFDLIVLLVEQRARSVDHQEIINAIWGRRPVGDATLRQLVHKARRAVGDDGAHQTTIHTLYGRSLQWIAEVEQVLVTEPVADPGVSERPESAHMEVAASDDVKEQPTAADPSAAPPDAAAAARPRRPRARMLYFSAGGLVVILAAIAIVVVARVGWGSQRPEAAGRTLTSPVPTQAVEMPVTIAVLPFLSMNPAQGEPDISDGLTVELINQLGRFPHLRVAARTSSFVFRDKPVDVREVARALGVDNILEGSVQRSGERVRVRVSLVSAKSGYELWSDEYAPAMGDVLKVEDEIAAAVIRQLHPQLDAHTLAVLRMMHAHMRVDPAAHDFYLVGLQYLNRRTVPDIQQAIRYFQRAILADPGYANAWSGVASAYAMLRDYDSDDPPDTYYAQALNAANKAVALDPQLPRAHAVLGLLDEEHWQWGPAQREFQRALQIDPSNALAHQWYAMFQWYMQDPHTALAQMRLAHDLDPLSAIVNTDLGRALLFNGQVDAAIVQYQATLKREPGFSLCHVLLAQAYMAERRDPEALKESRLAISLVPAPAPSSYLAVLGVALSLNGDAAGARQQLQLLEVRRQQHYVSGVALALLQAQLQQRDAMFASLARAITDHDPLLRPAVGARTAAWHGDLRFTALLARMGLPHHQ